MWPSTENSISLLKALFHGTFRYFDIIDSTSPITRSCHLIDYSHSCSYVVVYEQPISSSYILVYHPCRVEALFILEAWSYYLDGAGSSIKAIRVVCQRAGIPHNTTRLKRG